MRAVVGAVPPQFIDPMPEEPGVLARPEMGRVVESAGEQEVFRLQPRLLDPSLSGFSGGYSDLELHSALGLVLHDDGACRHLVAIIRPGP